MKNHGFYSKILAMSMLLGQVTPVAQAVNTESNIPGMYTANPFAHLMETEDKVETNGDSVVNNDESEPENKEGEIGTAVSQGSSQSSAIEVEALSGDSSEAESLFTEADTTWYHKDKTSFVISNAKELLGLSQLVCQGNSFEGKTITLEDTISLSGINWVPIGNSGTNKQEFQGTFDGNQMKITGLTISDTTASQQGLFYWVDRGAVVKNVILTGVDISADSIVGGISALNYGTIQNCAVSGSITAHDSTSGFGSCVGGLVGKNHDTGSIANCYNWSTVEGISNVGGIVGITVNQSTLANVYNIGDVTATSTSGSLVGYHDGGISYSYWLGTNGETATGNSSSLLTNCSSFDKNGHIIEVEEPDLEDTEAELSYSQAEAEEEEETDSNTAGAVYVITEEDGTILTRMNAWVEAQGLLGGYYSWQTLHNFPTFDEAYAHRWEYSIKEASGDEEGYITATCANSGDKITLTVHDLTYQGAEFTFDEIFSSELDTTDRDLTIDDFDLEEVFADLNYSDTVYDADSYSVTLADAIGELKFFVEQAELSLQWTGTSFKEDGDVHIPTAEISGLVGDDEEGEIELEISFVATEDGDEESKTVGSYTATAVLKNYNHNYVIPEGDETHLYTISALEIYTVNFYSDGEIIHSVTVIENDEVKTVTPPTTPDLGEDFRFDGWYTTDSFTYLFDFSKNVVNDLNLHAKWSELFTVTFDYDDNGVTPDTTTTVWEGETLTKPSPDPVRGNDEFGGWYTKTEEGLAGTSYDFNKVVTGPLFLIANWDVVYTATLHHNDDDNTITTLEGIGGNKLPEPSRPTRENYVFDGWYQDEALTKPWSFADDSLESDIDLYAKWVRQYTVSFDSQGGTSVISKKASEGGLVATPSQPSYTDFYFIGWYTDDTFTTEWNFAKDVVTGDMTLYALWEAFPSYIVNFESNGGSAVNSQVVQVEGLVEEPEDPILVGYEFAGWHIDADLYLPWDFANDVVAKEITLYAKWQKVVFLTYGHVYDYNGNGLIGTQLHLYQNGKQLANTQADINGYFTFGDLAEGVYNLMYTIGTKTVTTAIEVFYQEHQELEDMYMPEFTISSTVSISPQTSIYAVSGLYETTNYLTASQGFYDTYAIDLAVSNYVDKQESTLIENVMSPYDRIIEYFDVSITTEKNNQGQNNLNGTSNLIQIVMEIPWQYRNNDVFKVYRLHNDTLDIISSTPNSIGEHIEVSSNGKFISIFTKNFSTYALAYTADSKSESDFESGDQNGSEETRIYNVSSRYRLNGKETADTIMGSVSYSTSFPVYGTTVVVMPKVNYGYEVDYVTVVSDAGESMQVTSSSDGNYRFVQGLSPVTVTVAYVSSRVETNSQQFTDVFPGDSYFKAVNQVVDMGLMTGTGNGTFSPHSTITRGMLVTILYNLSGERHDGTARFMDVMPNDYFAVAVAWAQANDVVMGYEDNTFRPNQGITREEIAAIYYSYATYTNTLGNDWVYPTEYTDNAQIGAWARTAVAWCMSRDILDARFDNLFFPQSFGTRAEVAVSLLPML